MYATEPAANSERGTMNVTASTRPPVLVVWPNRPKAMAELDAGYRLVHLWQAASPEEVIDSDGPEIRAIVTTGERGASAALIERLPRLEVIACFGVGYDGIDVEACRARGIRVTNTPDVLSRDVADMGLGLILMTLRRMAEADRFVRRGDWVQDTLPLGTCLAGKKLGIVGLGRIGMELAKRARAVDMIPAYHNRSQRADVDLPYFATPIELARWADVLVLACPGGAATHHLVTAEVLEALGPEGWLINIARGSVVDETALVQALETGRIKGAGLDVFADEPRVPEALLAMENVVLQPHSASATEETRDAMAALVVANLDAHFAGRELVTPVA
jgi:lactate dehydrogenase-like 2-hydroxyacid dehydrogenase